ncbi:MAG: DUF4062 domain-containing protein [Nitrospiraceae bacterium]|nr:DUF4062 domain-containing protein [Nitrospiraceae bacterium]
MNNAEIVIFLSSPSGMKEARDLVVGEVRRINAAAGKKGLPKIKLIRWPEEIAAGAGDYLQSVINKQVDIYDIFITFLGSRLGTPTPRANSGTEEEFDLAISAIRSGKRVEVLLFFENEQKRIWEIDPHQLALVHYFRQKTERLGVLSHQYNDLRELRGLLKKSISAAYINACNAKMKLSCLTSIRPPENPQTIVATVERIVLRTKKISPQWADYYLFPIATQRYFSINLKGKFWTTSQYFRFGFKFGDAREPLFSAGSIQNHGQNIVVHIGKNLDKKDWFLTAYKHGDRSGINIPLPQLQTEKPVTYLLQIMQTGQVVLKLDELQVYEMFFTFEGLPRLLLMAWGDEHEYQCETTEVTMTVNH